MLRSSSAPLFGSILPESSIHSPHQLPEKNNPFIQLHYHQYRPHPMFLAAASGSSSPISPSITGNSFCRAQSESNLVSLEGSSKEDDEFESDDEAGDDLDLDFFNRTHSRKKEYISNGYGSGGGGGGAFFSRFSSGDGDEINQTEQNYKRMMRDDPSNPLILKNYAQFLLQAKGDLKGAETMCSRAILSDPDDGDVLAMYAEVSWRLHHDEEKCVFYFDRAAKASPDNSHVHAAYARFLWELEEEDAEKQLSPNLYQELCS